MTDLKVGDKVPDAAAMDTLPVGAAVTLNGSPKLLTKHADGWAQHRDYGGRHDGHAMWWEGMEIVSLPEAYAGPDVGEAISTEADLDALPGDAVISVRNRPDYRLQKVSGKAGYGNHIGGWQDFYSGGTKTPAEVLRNYTGLVVESLPDAVFETVKQFQWRFRDLSITGSERAQGSPQSATRVLERIPIEFDPTVGLRITNQYDRTNLPEGTRVYVGRPEVPDSFALFHKAGGRWVHIFGQPNLTVEQSVAVVIDALPDKDEPDEWLLAVPDQKEREAVEYMKSQVWKVGFKEKQDRGWCDEFERIMLRGGLSEETTRTPMPGGFRVGDPVTATQCAGLPLGTILRRDSADGFTIYQRVADAGNVAGTRRVVTTNGSTGNFSRSMTIVSEGDGVTADLNLRPSSIEEMDTMPPGTILLHGEPPVYRYVKRADGAWCQTNAPTGAINQINGGYANHPRDFSPGRNCGYRYDFTFAGTVFP